jgi:transposase
VSTSTPGGHVNTIPEQQPGTRRRRRKHSDEFKADAVAACMQPGMSMAAVAMAHGVNANLLRRWVQDAEKKPASCAISRKAVATVIGQKASFVPVALPAMPEPAKPQDIRIELQRGATSVTVTWPASAASECAAWMRELLR